jgi:hypothetical protein
MKRQIGCVQESSWLFESLTGPEFLERCGRWHDIVEEQAACALYAVLSDDFAIRSDEVDGVFGPASGHNNARRVRLPKSG